MNVATIIAGLERNKYNAEIADDARVLGLDEARRIIIEAFGGYTETASRGAWVNDAGAVITEAGVTWTIYSDLYSEVLETKLADLAASVAFVLDQASVLYAVSPVITMAFADSKHVGEAAPSHEAMMAYN